MGRADVDTWKGIAAKVIELFKEARPSTEPLSLVVDGLFTCVVGLRGESTQAPAAKLGFDHTGIELPPPEKDVLRTLGRIRKKINQLPKDKPALVVVGQQNPLFQVHGLDLLASVLAEAMRQYPQLLAVILPHKYLAGAAQNQEVRLGDHALLDVVAAGGLIERTVVIRNDKFALPMSSSTLGALELALESKGVSAVGDAGTLDL